MAVCVIHFLELVKISKDIGYLPCVTQSRLKVTVKLAAVEYRLERHAVRLVRL